MVEGKYIINIIHPINIKEVKIKSRVIVEQIGFEKKDIEKILITISELTSNLIKYAKGGSLILTPLDIENKKGIQIESVDNGSGINDIELAMVDGFSTSGSLGYGLGTVNRLMDEFKIYKRKNKGIHIVVKLWIQNRVKKGITSLDFGGASRPYPGYQLNGDKFIIKRWQENVLVGIIDGLGHGPLAHKASIEAFKYINKYFNQPIHQIFRGVNNACKDTRGIVMALVLFDLMHKKISFMGIGNIKARIFNSNIQQSFISRRGIIGRKYQKLKLIENNWDPGFVMILYSDGIISRWNWTDYSYIANKSAKIIAYQMLEDLARDNDDATIVVIKDFNKI